jgi:hypothetical protein
MKRRLVLLGMGLGFSDMGLYKIQNINEFKFINLKILICNSHKKNIYS